MPEIPEPHNTTHAAIVRWYESKPQEHRPHMGASLIGHPCDRHIWLTWRWALKPEFKGRILRLFSSGQREESRLIEELRGIGVEVWDTDPNTGTQWRASACNGHFAGSLDGVAKGVAEAPKTPCVLEFKTHNDKSFKGLMSKGVKKAKPQHYDQMTVYMGLMDLTRALYMAVNKDNDELYTEWVHFDQTRFAALMERAQRLIEATEPPPKLSDDKEYFECKWCSNWKLCHGGQAAEPNCRTCCHASPVENAAWHCRKHSKELSEQAQRAGCGDHLLIPALVPYGEAVDGGDNWVAYQHRETKAYFVNGTEQIKDYGPVFSSKELHNCPGSLIAEISAHKNEWPGSKVTSGSVKGPFDSGFDDMPSDDLDAIPIKPLTKAEQKARAQNKAMVEQMRRAA